MQSFHSTSQSFIGELSDFADIVADFFVGNNIPLYKLRSDASKRFFQRLNKPTPSETTCRQRIEGMAEKQFLRIKELVAQKDIFVAVDEADVCGQRYVNFLVGVLEEPHVICSTVDIFLQQQMPKLYCTLWMTASANWKLIVPTSVCFFLTQLRTWCLPVQRWSNSTQDCSMWPALRICSTTVLCGWKTFSVTSIHWLVGSRMLLSKIKVEKTHSLTLASRLCRLSRAGAVGCWRLGSTPKIFQRWKGSSFSSLVKGSWSKRQKPSSKRQVYMLIFEIYMHRTISWSRLSPVWSHQLRRYVRPTNSWGTFSSVQIERIFALTSKSVSGRMISRPSAKWHVKRFLLLSIACYRPPSLRLLKLSDLFHFLTKF